MLKLSGGIPKNSFRHTTVSCALMFTRMWLRARTLSSIGIGTRFTMVRRPTGKAYLGHDLTPGRAYEEVSRTAHELQRIGPEIANIQRKNQVAILYSDDSYYGIEFMNSAIVRTTAPSFGKMCGALYRSNVGVDFVFPESTNLSAYRVILVPPLYVASDAVLAKLVDYVKAGANLVLSFKSGFCNEYSTVRWEMAPGPLRDAAGLHYQEFSSLLRPLALKDDPFQVGADNRVSDWAEMLILDTRETARLLRIIPSSPNIQPLLTMLLVKEP